MVGFRDYKVGFRDYIVGFKALGFGKYTLRVQGPE